MRTMKQRKEEAQEAMRMLDVCRPATRRIWLKLLVKAPPALRDLADHIEDILRLDGERGTTSRRRQPRGKA